MTTEQKPALDHGEIARLACQIWQKEGCPPGRDQEYWLQAERQLQTISQTDHQPKNVSAKRKVASTIGKCAATLGGIVMSIDLRDHSDECSQRIVIIVSETRID